MQPIYGLCRLFGGSAGVAKDTALIRLLACYQLYVTVAVYTRKDVKANGL